MTQQNCVIALIVMMVVGQVNCNLPAGFERCDNSGTLVKEFTVTACPDGATSGSPCKLKPFDGLGFKIDFVSEKTFDSVSSHMDLTNYDNAKTFPTRTSRAVRKVYGIVIDACQLGLACPGKANQLQHMEQLYYFGNELLDSIKSNTMEFYLTDDKTHERIVCVRFPVEIEAK